MKQLVKNLDNKQVGSVDLKKEIFSSTLRPDIIIRVVNWPVSYTHLTLPTNREV